MDNFVKYGGPFTGDAVVVYGGSFPDTADVCPGTITYFPSTVFSSGQKKKKPKPFCCPVCLGRGLVGRGFYEFEEKLDFKNPILCRTCNGKGILWRE
jgi:hypothetical protein